MPAGTTPRTIEACRDTLGSCVHYWRLCNAMRLKSFGCAVECCACESVWTHTQAMQVQSSGYDLSLLIAGAGSGHSALLCAFTLVRTWRNALAA